VAVRKLMIIGLDAASLELVRPWVEEGLLPNFARFLREGAAGILQSTLPPCSPAAWSTFATGANPGRHGLLGFQQFGPRDYEPRLMSAADRRGATFWEVAAAHGLRCGVLNMPFTYPPRPFDGFLVAGMLSPSLNSSMAHPPGILADLLRASPRYSIDVDIFAAPHRRPEAFLDLVLQTTQARLEAAVGLYRKHRPDVFCVVFVGADRICHFFWPFLEAARAGRELTAQQRRLADGIRIVYQKLDGALGCLLAEAGPDCDVLVLSDHGACGLRRGLSLRRALQQAGLLVERHAGPYAALKKRLVLSLARWVPRTLKKRLMGAFPRLARNAAGAAVGVDADFRRTRAYPTGWTQGVFVNLRGRQPMGIVEPGAEYEAVREEVIAALSALCEPETGRRVVRKVHRREEVWSGPCLEELPDLVVELADHGLAVSATPSDEETGVFYDLPEPSWTALHPLGGHHPDGLLMGLGPHVRPGTVHGAKIADVTATVLALAGCPIPQDVDGRVLTEMLTDDVPAPRRLPPAEGADQGGAGNGLAGNERAAVEMRLKGLGYM
jgi:predicted AlkP superfamily phosphohydrolase/phosphomutase